VEKQIASPMSAFRASNLLLKGAKGGTKPTWAIIEEPGVWQRGVSGLFDSYILPESLGGRPENIHLAWLGDKILAIHVANCLVDIFGRPIHRGVASEIHSTAVSNKFLRNHFGSLVPILANAQDIEPKLTDEIAGTVVETAIARIHSQSQESGPRKAHEIIDLSNYLVKSAIIDKIQSGMKQKT
jgi:hypothetical protein